MTENNNEKQSKTISYCPLCGAKLITDSDTGILLCERCSYVPYPKEENEKDSDN